MTYSRSLKFQISLTKSGLSPTSASQESWALPLLSVYLWSVLSLVLLPSTSQVTSHFTQILFLGNMKDVVLTYVGFMFFDDITLTFMVGLGLALSFIGAGSYAFDSYLKEREKQK